MVEDTPGESTILQQRERHLLRITCTLTRYTLRWTRHGASKIQRAREKPSHSCTFVSDSHFSSLNNNKPELLTHARVTAVLVVVTPDHYWVVVIIPHPSKPRVVISGDCYRLTSLSTNPPVRKSTAQQRQLAKLTFAAHHISSTSDFQLYAKYARAMYLRSRSNQCRSSCNQVT